MMVEVTQDDIGWATSAAQHLCHPIDSPAAIRLLADAFARHRIAAEQRGKLEGARLAIEAIGLIVDDYNREIIEDLDPAKIVGEG